MSESDAYEAGLELRRRMFGPAGADEAIANASDIGAPLQRIVTEFCFGEIWQREGLTKRERSMITIAMMMGAGRTRQLPVHIQGALANGVSREELREIVLHSMLYLGIPGAAEATAICDKVLGELQD